MGIPFSATNSIFAYNGDLATLLGLSVLPSIQPPVSGVFNDEDGVLGSGTPTTVTLSNGVTGEMDFIGSGTVELSLLGLVIDSRPISAFSVDGQIYIYAPEGFSLAAGVVATFNIDAGVPFELFDGAVDGLETGQTMGLGYTDADGDSITNFNDTIFGNGGDDSISAAGGADAVSGGTGNDTIDGGAGNDTIYGDGGNDSIIGGSGNDTLYGGIGNDTLDGGIGNDVIYGDDGNDSIIGGSGNDTIYGGAGNDTLDGGTGNDVVYGGEGDDVWLNTETSALGGSDTVYLEGGDDYAQLGWLTPGTPEIIDGGDGIDTFALDHATLNNFDIDLTLNDSGSATSNTISADNVILNFENVLGNAGVNELTGNSSANYLWGMGGNDILSGGGGDDTLDGGSDDDSLDGGDGNDSIIGGSGNDSIDGGQGSDTLAGNAGDDLIAGGAGDDVFVYAAGDGADTITDFGTDDSGDIDDGIQTNNDFIDLESFYNETSLAAVNAEPGNNFQNQLEMMRADAADGVLDGEIDGTDYAAIGDINLTLESGGTAVDPLNLTNDNTNVTCFAAGTKIKTLKGELKIDDLKSGDEVLTLDSGYKAIRWIGSSPISSDDLALNPKLRPIRIRAGSLGVGLPEEDLLVSPQHRILIRSNIAERMFGKREVLMAAKHLTEIDGIDIAEDQNEVTYWHFLFEDHQIVFSNGTPTESLYTGPEALKSVSSEARSEIFEIFPELRVIGRAEAIPARTFVPGRRARKFAERSAGNRKILVA